VKSLQILNFEGLWTIFPTVTDIASSIRRIKIDEVATGGTINNLNEVSRLKLNTP